MGTQRPKPGPAQLPGTCTPAAGFLARDASSLNPLSFSPLPPSCPPTPQLLRVKPWGTGGLVVWGMLQGGGWGEGSLLKAKPEVQYKRWDLSPGTRRVQGPTTAARRVPISARCPSCSWSLGSARTPPGRGRAIVSPHRLFSVCCGGRAALDPSPKCKFCHSPQTCSTLRCARPARSARPNAHPYTF